jgi:integrase
MVETLGVDPTAQGTPKNTDTGARIVEICQLRSEDIKQIDSIWCIAFAAEAGSLKNLNSERVVPVHPALIDEGFLKFAATAGKGPLFPDLSEDRFGRRGGNGTKILGRWIKALGIVDKRLAPNHSWRHRTKTLGLGADNRIELFSDLA